MADHPTKREKLHFEDITSSKIQSEVPGVQKLREDYQEVTTELSNDTDTFVPVMTVTKKEVVFTKGDMKLQKITDSETPRVEVVNPFYSEIQAQTLEAPQRVRSYENGNDIVKAEDKKTTRIPSYKFKQIADKFKQDSNETENKVNKGSHNLRRSSIPRLIRLPSTEDKRLEIGHDNEAQPNTTNSQEEEDEFDKIYHEVVDDEQNFPVFEAVIKEDRIDDPDKLESNFDEIVHEYDEGKLQPLSLDVIRQSKIPLPRRKSQGLEITKYTRRFNKSLSVDNSKIKTYPRDNDFHSLPYIQSNESKIPSLQRNNVSRVSDSTKNKTQNERLNRFIPIYNNMFNKTVVKEKVEQEVIETHFDIDPENEPLENSDTIAITNEDEINTSPNIVDGVGKNYDQIEAVDEETDTENVNKNSEEETDQVKVNENRHKNINPIDIINEVPITKSVSSRIALFERQDPIVPKTNIPQPKQNLRVHRKEKLKIQELNLNDKPRIIEEVLKSPFRKEFEQQEIEATFNNVDNIENSDEINRSENESKVFVPDNEESPVIFKNINIKSNNSDNEQFVMHNETQQTEGNNLEENEAAQDAEEIKNEAAEAPSIINETNISNSHETEPSFISYTFTEVDMNPPENKEAYKSYRSKDEQIIKKSINERYLPFENIENRMKRLHSHQEERKKSISEVDLALMRGKVKAMIVRINSEENLDQKTDSRMKGMPKHKSVIEKIALFEKKQVPIKMEEKEATVNISTEKEQQEEVKDNKKEQEEKVDYTEKITELKNAKNKYGGTTKMEYIELNNGIQMPVLAVGTAMLDPNLLHHIITAAIDLGYRAIDTAFIYSNEEQVGRAIREKIGDGTVERKDLFIISKLWSTFHRIDLVEKACKESLERMGLDYFDLYLIHNPMSFKEGPDPLPKIANVLQYSTHDYLDAWYGMEALVSKGLVRSIGVSNFNSVQLARVIEKGRVMPVVNQVECHLYLNQQRLGNFCADRGVKLSCYGTLGSKGTPAEYKNGVPAVIDDPIVLLSAAALEVTPAQLLIRYQLDLDHSVVVKSSSAARLWENLQVLDKQLDPEQIDALSALNKNKRNFTYKGMGDTHRNYPFKIPF